MSACNYKKKGQYWICALSAALPVTLKAQHRPINTVNINHSLRMLAWRCSINNEWRIDFVVSNFVGICNFKWVLFFFIMSISCELGSVFAREKHSLQSAVSSFYAAIRHQRLKAKTIFLLLSQATNADLSVCRHSNISSCNVLMLQWAECTEIFCAQTLGNIKNTCWKKERVKSVKSVLYYQQFFIVWCWFSD